MDVELDWIILTILQPRHRRLAQHRLETSQAEARCYAKLNWSDIRELPVTYAGSESDVERGCIQLMNKPYLVVATVAILGLGFIITDCSTGRTVHDEGTVHGRYYKPPWTEITMDCDEDGCTFDTIDHPEEWHTTVEVTGTGQVRDFNAGKNLYLILTNGQFITIQSRQGRWTGTKYLGTISP